MLKSELLLYTPLAHRASCRLKDAVATVVSLHATEIVHTPTGLVHRLRKLDNRLEVAVILADNRKKLWELQSLEQMLESLRLILILPDTDPQTIAQAHNLRPRYITSIYSDFQDVCAVLKKMLALPGLPLEPTPSL